MALMKLTQDDASFQQYIGQQLKYSLDKAERCTQNVSTQMMSKNTAGYGDNNLKKDAFVDLKQALVEEARAMNEEESLKQLLEQQDQRERLADQKQK